MTTWDQSVERARSANRQALEGRFQLTLASFEQFAPFGVGYRQDGFHGRVGRTLSDWAEEVGISYHTLNAYRQVVSWWYESDPNGLRDEIPMPTYVAWEALKFAKQHYPRVTDFRDALDTADGPQNGVVWSLLDVEYLVRKSPPPRKRTKRKQEPDPFDFALGGIGRVAIRLEKFAELLNAGDLTAEQKRQLQEATDEAREALDTLLEALGLEPVG